MKVNIYYGGRGLIEDPTIYVLNIIEEVLADYRVETQRFNIYERKNEISTLPMTLKDADGVILATTVEWLGIGGFMTQFLDACWLYGKKERIQGIYMQPVVMSTTYGEREAVLMLENAWERLGGLPCAGVSGYVEDKAAFEENEGFKKTIENRATDLYRMISRAYQNLPSGNQAVMDRIYINQSLELTQQESDQLSLYAADDDFVTRQKEDIYELSTLYRNMIGEEKEDESTEFISSFKSHFEPQGDFKATYQFDIEEKHNSLFVAIDGAEIECFYGKGEADVLAKMSFDTMERIVSGQISFQGAFSMGEMKARGQLPNLQKLDELFSFK